MSLWIQATAAQIPADEVSAATATARYPLDSAHAHRDRSESKKSSVSLVLLSVTFPPEAYPAEGISLSVAA